jgi:hypothetical protein
MSNARLRRKLETLGAPVVAALIDLGHAHNDGGILEFSYHGYCNPGNCILEAARVVQFKTQQVPVPEMRVVRERL